MPNPPPYLILSDIHANLEALQAVVADAAGQYDRILCLGDLVGYGADPNAVVEWTRENARVIIRGNHDRAAAGSEPLESFNPAARLSTHWTRNALTTANREFLERLPRGPLPYEGFDLIHGSPADEDEYLITLADVALIRPYLGAQLSFFGHTHRQGGFLLARRATSTIRPELRLEIEPDYLYLVNPGSVGQPRDSDPRAAYAMYSPVEGAVEFRRVAYDIERAAAKIRAAGLPDSLAARLFEGT
jgi:predicted phosphodiesterase